MKSFKDRSGRIGVREFMIYRDANNCIIQRGHFKIYNFESSLGRIDLRPVAFLNLWDSDDIYELFRR